MIIRAINPDREYEIETEAVLFYAARTMGQDVSLSAVFVDCLPEEDEVHFGEDFLDALEYPRPVSWGIRVIGPRSR